MNKLKRNEDYHASLRQKSETPTTIRGSLRENKSHYSKANGLKLNTPNSLTSRNPFFQESEPYESRSAQLRSRFTSISKESNNIINMQRTAASKSNYKAKPSNDDEEQPDLIKLLNEGLNKRISQNKSKSQIKTPTKAKKFKLVLASQISIHHYYLDENEPPPLKGELVSKINNIPIIKLKSKSSKRSPIKTKPSQFAKATNSDSNIRKKNSPPPLKVKDHDIDVKKANKKIDMDELQFVTPILMTPRTSHSTIERRPRGKSVPQKADAVAERLFADDAIPISFFDFDFATSYVLDNDDVMEEVKPLDVFPIIDIMEIKTNNPSKYGNIQDIIKASFRSFEETKPNISLTTLVLPYKDEIEISQKTNLINAIAPTPFFDFRFGNESSESSPDRLHIFTWHNLGIPASVIAKNLLVFISAPRDHLNIQTQVKAILQYLLIWIKYFPYDFYEQTRCSDIIFQLLKLMTNKNKSSTKGIDIMYTLMEDLSQGIYTPEDLYPQIRPPLNRTFPKIHKLMHLSIDPYILANHFAYLDLQLIHKLNRNEFMHNNWQERPEDSPNFQLLMKRFNHTVQFIITSILIETEKRRARNISYWVKMMYHARKERNYHLLAVVDSALSSLPIMRLSKTWKMVNNNALLAFYRLHNFFKRTDNQREMLSDPSKSIPFIGIFLAQLYQIEEENYKTVMKSGADGYNLSLQRKVLSIVEQIFLPWGTAMDFELDNAILKECENFEDIMDSPDQMMEASLEIEPIKRSEKSLLDDYIRHSDS